MLFLLFRYMEYEVKKAEMQRLSSKVKVKGRVKVKGQGQMSGQGQMTCGLEKSCTCYLEMNLVMDFILGSLKKKQAF